MADCRDLLLCFVLFLYSDCSFRCMEWFLDLGYRRKIIIQIMMVFCDSLQAIPYIHFFAMALVEQ